MRIHRALLALSVGAAVLLPMAPTAQSRGETTLAIAGRSNQTPWVATAGDLVAVTWGATADGKADVFLAVSRDRGQTFASPVRVNAVDG